MPEQIQLIPDGPKISNVVYGTWRLLDDDPKPTPDTIKERFELCEELGITTIDTAEIYGGYQVEEAIGDAFRAHKGLRNGLQIITKCGIDVPNPAKPHARLPHYNASSENIVACAEKSLKLLGTDRIDLLLVHRPDWFERADDTAYGLEKLMKDGKVLHVGVSNYLPGQFDLLNDRLKLPLVTNQVEISLLEMSALYDGTLAQAERTRTRPMAWSPLAGGSIFDPENKAASRIRECMDKMKDRYDGADYDTLAFAWVMAHPSGPVPIIGTNKVDRIRSQAKAGDIKMERQDWYALWEAAQGTSVP